MYLIYFKHTIRVPIIRAMASITPIMTAVLSWFFGFGRIMSLRSLGWLVGCDKDVWLAWVEFSFYTFDNPISFISDVLSF